MNSESRAIADLLFAAARTPPSARRNGEGDARSALAVLVGEREAEVASRLNLGALAMMTTPEMRRHGLSAEAAQTLRAAFRVAVQAAHEAPLPAAKITNPGVVADLMRDKLALLPHEEVWALFLAKRSTVKADLLVSKMGFDAAHVDARVIFHGALEVQALSFVLVHNHPSGDPQPSQADVSLSRQLVQQGQLMAIPLVDHVIITRGGFSSLQSMGMIS